jgi:flagellar biosynthesis/type III secretory pathway M-ring protein FliF/YscJ
MVTKNLMTAEEFWSNPAVIIVGLLLIFGLIVLGVILAKKYIPGLKTTEKPKTREEIAKEEVERMTRPIEEDKRPELDEEAEELAEVSKEGEKPADDTLARSTRPVEDEEAAKAMAKYAEEHPEEAAAVAPKEEKKDDVPPEKK